MNGIINSELIEPTFNPHTPSQLDKIITRLSALREIVDKRDNVAMKQFLDQVRSNLK